MADPICSCANPGETHSPALHVILGDPLPDTLRLLPLNDLAQAVLMRRTWQGLTSRDLAAEIGVAPSTITRVEQGNAPTAETYRRLCLWLAQPAGEFHERKARP